MNRLVIWLSGGLTGILAGAYYGNIWRDEDWRPFAAVAFFILAFIVGAYCLVTSRPPLRGASLYVIAIAYWISFALFGAVAIWTYVSI